YNGSQCGYCTPGFVMNMHAFLRSHDQPTQQDIENLFGGNLCRCTGYRPILSGMRTFACDHNPQADPSLKCEPDPCFPIEARLAPLPLSLATLPAFGEAAPLYFRGPDLHWLRPVTLEDALDLRGLLTREAGRERVRVLVGNTASVLYPEEKP